MFIGYLGIHYMLQVLNRYSLPELLEATTAFRKILELNTCISRDGKAARDFAKREVSYIVEAAGLWAEEILPSLGVERRA